MLPRGSIFWGWRNTSIFSTTFQLLGDPTNWKITFCFLDLKWIESRNVNSEKAMATHSSTLAWKIPWMEEPGRLQSMGSLWVGHDWAISLFSFSCIGEGNGNPSSVLAWRIPGTGEPSGLRSMGSHRVGHTWSDLAAAALLKLYSSLTEVVLRSCMSNDVFWNCVEI